VFDPVIRKDVGKHLMWDSFCMFQFFLSNRAVYLLLWNIRLGYEHAGIDFWLSSIACHAPKAPVLIVGSHKDQVCLPCFQTPYTR
jgi:hypothetical protein